MKTKILTTLLLSLAISSCQKQPEEVVASTTNKTDPVAKAKFEKSDAIINNYMDRLESPKTTMSEKTKILCKNYPTEYKTNYMPALLQLTAKDYTEARLLSDLEIALDYYKKKDNIHC